MWIALELWPPVWFLFAVAALGLTEAEWMDACHSGDNTGMCSRQQGPALGCSKCMAAHILYIYCECACMCIYKIVATVYPGESSEC